MFSNGHHYSQNFSQAQSQQNPSSEQPNTSEQLPYSHLQNPSQSLHHGNQSQNQGYPSAIYSRQQHYQHYGSTSSLSGESATKYDYRWGEGTHTNISGQTHQGVDQSTSHHTTHQTTQITTHAQDTTDARARPESSYDTRALGSLAYASGLDIAALGPNRSVSTATTNYPLPASTTASESYRRDSPGQTSVSSVRESTTVSHQPPVSSSTGSLYTRAALSHPQLSARHLPSIHQTYSVSDMGNSHSARQGTIQNARPKSGIDRREHTISTNKEADPHQIQSGASIQRSGASPVYQEYRPPQSSSPFHQMKSNSMAEYHLQHSHRASQAISSKIGTTDSHYIPPPPSKSPDQHISEETTQYNQAVQAGVRRSDGVVTAHEPRTASPFHIRQYQPHHGRSSPLNQTRVPQAHSGHNTSTSFIPTTVDPSQVYNPHHEYRRQAAAAEAKAAERNYRQVEEAVKPSPATENAQSARRSASTENQQPTVTTPIGSSSEKPVSKEQASGAAVHNTPSISNANPHEPTEDMESHVRTMVENLRKYQSIDPTKFAKVWEEVKKVPSHAGTPTQSGFQQLSGAPRLSNASAESMRLPTGQLSDLNTIKSQALPVSAQQGVSTEIKTQAAPLGRSSELLSTATQASAPVAQQVMPANAPNQKRNKLPKEKAVPTSRKSKSRAKSFTLTTNEKATRQDQFPQISGTEVRPHIQVEPFAPNAPQPQTGTHWPESSKPALSSAAAKALQALSTSTTNDMSTSPDQPPQFSGTEFNPSIQVGPSASNASQPQTGAHWPESNEPAVSSAAVRALQALSTSATNNQATHQDQPPQISGMEVRPHIQMEPSALTGPQPRKGTYWPEAQKAAISTAVVEILRAIPENVGKSMNTHIINGILDTSPSYPELCQILENKGLLFDRGHVARTIMKIGKDAIAPTSLPILHEPSSVPPAAHPSQDGSAKVSALQMPSVSRAADTNLTDPAEKERKKARGPTGRSRGRPRKDGTPAQPRANVGEGAQDNASNINRIPKSLHDTLLKAPVKRSYEQTFPSQTAQHDDFRSPEVDSVESQNVSAAKRQKREQIITGTPSAAQDSSAKRQNSSSGSAKVSGVKRTLLEPQLENTTRTSHLLGNKVDHISSEFISDTPTQVKKTSAIGNSANSTAVSVTSNSMPESAESNSTVTASGTRAAPSNGVVMATGIPTATPLQHPTQINPAGKSQETPPVRTKSKAEAARKRSWSEIVDLTQSISDDDFYTPRLAKNPRIVGQTVASKVVGPSLQGSGPSQAKKSAAQSSGNGISNAFSVTQATRHSLSGRDLVRSFSRGQALRRSTYDTRTIARDVLIASGRHPRMRGLNEHLDRLKQNFSTVTNSSDLSTFRWDIVDPAPPTSGVGKGQEVNQQSAKETPVPQVVDVSGAGLSTGKKTSLREQPGRASKGTKGVPDAAEVGSAVVDVSAAALSKSREVCSRLLGLGLGTERLAFVASTSKDKNSNKTALTSSQKRRREPESEMESGSLPPITPSSVQHVHKRMRPSLPSQNTPSNPVVASRGGTNTTSVQIIPPSHNSSSNPVASRNTTSGQTITPSQNTPSNPAASRAGTKTTSGQTITSSHRSSSNPAASHACTNITFSQTITPSQNTPLNPTASRAGTETTPGQAIPPAHNSSSNPVISRGATNTTPGKTISPPHNSPGTSRGAVTNTAFVQIISLLYNSSSKPVASGDGAKTTSGHTIITPSQKGSSNPLASRRGTKFTSRQTARLSTVSNTRSSRTPARSTLNTPQSRIVKSQRKARKNIKLVQIPLNDFAVVIYSHSTKGSSSTLAQGSSRKKPAARTQPAAQKKAAGRKKAGRRTEVYIDAEETGIPMPTYRCRWTDCQAELHNVDVLRAHIMKVHKPTATHGVFHCPWNGCLGIYDPESVEDTDRPYTFESEEAVFEHVNKMHIEAYGWQHGDGPFAGQTVDNPSDPPYFKDAMGRRVFPTLQALQSERLRCAVGRGFLPNAAWFKAHEMTTKQQRNQAILDSISETQRRSDNSGFDIGAAVCRGGPRFVTPAMRRNFVARKQTEMVPRV
ncbi:MAG: hypothetical protein M1816_004169 [Peltula sp. TS41687]|nr:MAG: hypothetical protein M1816_004169 [Peltula sp. TS41687]